MLTVCLLQKCFEIGGVRTDEWEVRWIGLRPKNAQVAMASHKTCAGSILAYQMNIGLILCTTISMTTPIAALHSTALIAELDVRISRLRTRTRTRTSPREDHDEFIRWGTLCSANLSGAQEVTYSCDDLESYE